MKEIRLLWFDMNTPVHHNFGLWRHPRNRSNHYTSLSYWTDLARTLERGKFDGLFLADVTGIYDVFAGNAEGALRHAVQVPTNDPLMILSAMAHVTEHLGLAATVNLSNEKPHQFARRMSTLDHITGGRACWNIVTGYLDSGAKAIGRDKQVSHDIRYDIADDFMDAVYKLWEESWDDNAVILNDEQCIYTDPSRVRSVEHKGEYFQLDATHLCEPSPQRTPLLFQAGSSPRGVEFAAKHAECVFVGGPSAHAIAPLVSNLRKSAAAQGRDPSSIKIFMGATAIVAPTDDEAKEKFDDYQKYSDPEAVLVFLSGASGIDFSKFDLDHVITENPADPAMRAMATAVKILTADPKKSWTLRELGAFASIGGPTPKFVGSPQRIAEEMQSWIDATDVDGFNLVRTVAPECIDDVVDLLVPELQRRGIYKKEYVSGTLRHKILGGGPRLHRVHYGAGFARAP